MNNYIVKQKDIELLMQSDKELYYKLELLNEDLRIIDHIDGLLISDNISIDSKSDIRRTYTCTLYIKDSSFVLSRDSKIFFNKLVRPHIGIMHQKSSIIQWYCLGTFLYTDLNYSYDETNKTLQITCLDLMCLLNDSRKGQLPDYKRTILANTDAREVIISLLKEADITRYFIEFNINGNQLSTFSIPYDLTFEAGTTIYAIISEIVNLYAGTQMYFSLDGTFVISRIPTSKNETNVLTDDILQQILINEQVTTSLSNIYNHIKIYGKMNEPDYYTKDVTCNENVYYANVVVMKLDENGEYVEVEYKEQLDNFNIFALKIPCTNTNIQYININNIGNILIVDDSGNYLNEGLLEVDTDYLFEYRRATNDFLFLGNYQCIGEAWLSNNIEEKNKYAVIDETSAFAVEVIGDRLKVLSGSDYDSIYTNSLCNQRARLELYNASNMQDSLSISIIAVPWLDVNMKIKFTSNATKQTHEYIITNISCDYSTYQMSVNLSRYYPDYI